MVTAIFAKTQSFIRFIEFSLKLFVFWKVSRPNTKDDNDDNDDKSVAKQKQHVAKQHWCLQWSVRYTPRLTPLHS